ncbi:lytic transglycosylase domain-containing protein, partial [Paraburkholderia humisilvae]
MTTQTKHQAHSSTAPAHVVAPPPALKWCYPFPRKGGGEVTDPQVFYHALGQMTDGFFPLGVNGFPHGGVHFGAMSAACVDQSGGVRLHADGEIVAYRIDGRYPHLQFRQDSRWALYSTGFVLVRHRMTLPPPPGHTAPQPADETLTFFSLFMHMADWKSYLEDGRLARPDWWLGVDAYRVAGRDRQKPDAQGNSGDGTGAFVYTEPKAAAKKGQFSAGTCVAFLQKDSEVVVGEKRGEWRHIKAVTSGAMTGATHGSPFGTKDLTVPWQRPDGDDRGRVPLTPEGDWGWLHLHDEQPVREPEGVGSVVIP